MVSMSQATSSLSLKKRRKFVIYCFSRGSCGSWKLSFFIAKPRYLYGTPWKSHIQAYCVLKPPHGPTLRGSDGLNSSEKIVSRSGGWISTWKVWKNENEIFMVLEFPIYFCRVLTFRIIYFSGTVGNICLIADARSVIITSAFCFCQNKGRNEIMIYFHVWPHYHNHRGLYSTYRTKVACIAGCQKWIGSVVGDDWKMTRFLAFHRLYV